MPFILVLIAVVCAAVLYRMWAKRRAQQALLRAPLSAHQRQIITQNVPLVGQLPQQFHSTLEGKINLFLEQVSFYGCDDLEVTKAAPASRMSFRKLPPRSKLAFPDMANYLFKWRFMVNNF